MTTPKKRLIFHWTTSKNLLAIFFFVILITIIQYIFITYTMPIAPDHNAFTIPALNVEISLLYHLLPIAVIITLTAGFTHLTTHIATLSPKPQSTKKPPPQTARQKYTWLKPLNQFHKKIQKATQRLKNKTLKTPAIAHLQHRVVLAKALIKSATATTGLFIAVVFLIGIAAYPKLIPTATADFLQWNTTFLGFITATFEASHAIANAVPPIGAIATAIHAALIAAAPAFHNTLKSTASSMTSDLVALSPTEKYLVTQNAAAWAAAIATLLYGQYVRIRRYRR